MFLLLLIFNSLNAINGLRFAHTYGSHMVLQKAPQRAVVWGYYSTDISNVSLILGTQNNINSIIVPTFPGQIPNTWMAKLPAKAASNTSHTMTLIEQNTTIILEDVLFGDVWVCSGQSNMAFLLQNAFNGSQFVNDSGQYPHLRVFTSYKNNSPKQLREQPEIQEGWSVSSPSAVSQQAQHRDVGVDAPLDDNWLVFSAVCYLYGQEIMKHTQYPVGLVNTNWGGTPDEFWSSEESLEHCDDTQTTSGGAYNGMISPLLNMTIYGAIWYQGESNIGDKMTAFDSQGLPMATYGCTFPSMIADWRRKFHAGSLGETSDAFFFGYVQLASWIGSGFGPPSIRWAQGSGYGYVPNEQMPNVFNAIAIDLTDRTSPYGSVHIRDKLSVAKRLSAGGIAMAYGNNDTYWQGPIVKSAKTGTDSSVVVTFINTGIQKDGLVVRNVTGWEMCILDAVNPGANCSLAASPTTTKQIGDWFEVHVIDSTRDSVTVRPMAAVLDINSLSNQRTMVRYAWKSLAFEYKMGGLYSKSTTTDGVDFPAGPFVVVAEN